MSYALVRNLTGGPFTLPFPYSGIINVNGAKLFLEEPETVIAKFGGAAAIKRILSVEQYDHPDTGADPGVGADSLPAIHTAGAFIKRNAGNTSFEEVAYSATVPADVGTTAAAGSASDPAHRDHVHALSFTSAPSPGAVATAAVVGTSGIAAHADHVHALAKATIQTLVGAMSRLVGLADPDAASATAVHAAVEADDANIFPGPITNPDVPRNVTATFQAGWDGGDITVDGTDQFDAVIQEVLADNPGGSTTGNKAFKTVTAITKETVGVTANTVTIGTGTKLGVAVQLVNTECIVFVDGVSESGTANVTNNTVAPTTAPNGAKVFKTLVNI